MTWTPLGTFPPQRRNCKKIREAIENLIVALKAANNALNAEQEQKVKDRKAYEANDQ